MKEIRQGDVLLIPVKEIPEGHRTTGDLVLAYGEVTGHSHRVMSGAELIEAENGRRYLEIVGVAELIHEEHDKAVLTEPYYEVRTQLQYQRQEIKHAPD